MTRRAGGLNDGGTGRRGGGKPILGADEVDRRPRSTGIPQTAERAEVVARTRPGADEGARASRGGCEQDDEPDGDAGVCDGVRCASSGCSSAVSAERRRTSRCNSSGLRGTVSSLCVSVSRKEPLFFLARGLPNARLLLLGDCSGRGPVAVRGKCRDPDLKPRVSVARSFSTEQPRVGVEGSSLGRIDVGLQVVGVVVVVDVEKPRLGKRRDNKSSCCASFEGVQDCLDVVGQLFPPFVSNVCGLVFLYIVFVVGGLHLLDVHRVGRLVSHDVFQSCENAQIEGVGEVRRMGHQKTTL